MSTRVCNAPGWWERLIARLERLGKRAAAGEEVSVLYVEVVGGEERNCDVVFCGHELTSWELIGLLESVKELLMREGVSR